MRRLVGLMVVIVLVGCTDSTRSLSTDLRPQSAYVLQVNVRNPTSAPAYVSRCSVGLYRGEGRDVRALWKPDCSFWNWPREMGGMTRIEPGQSTLISIEISTTEALRLSRDGYSTAYRVHVATFPEIPVVRVITSMKDMIHAQNYWITDFTLLRRQP